MCQRIRAPRNIQKDSPYCYLMETPLKAFCHLCRDGINYLSEVVMMSLVLFFCDNSQIPGRPGCKAWRKKYIYT